MLNVYQKTQERLEWLMDNDISVCVSLSGGKDSSVLIQLIDETFAEYGYPYDVVFCDMELEYDMTYQHVQDLCSQARALRNFYQICLPMTYTLSFKHPLEFTTWNPHHKNRWMHDIPQNAIRIGNNNVLDAIGIYDQKDKKVPTLQKFQYWYENTSKADINVFCMGIRYKESYKRMKILYNTKSEYVIEDDMKWLQVAPSPSKYPLKKSAVGYPICDWSYGDVYKCMYMDNHIANPMYNRIYKTGVPLSKIRLSSPLSVYSNDLLFWRLYEPETYNRLINRINVEGDTGSIQQLIVDTEQVIKQKIPIHHPPNVPWENYVVYQVKLTPNEIVRRELAFKIAKRVKKYTEPTDREKMFRAISRCIDTNDYNLLTLNDKYASYKNNAEKWKLKISPKIKNMIGL